MSDQKTRISCEIDFDKDGKQNGFLRLPYSVHRSAYGWLPFPVICIKNGEGPTAYLQSGNHGDEYEGQIAFLKLARALEPADVRGRVIIFPTANAPAARAGTRTSPLDGGNLNRSFPGDPDGSPTRMIAHYIESVFLDLADYAFDLHSGGSSLMLIPSIDLMHVEEPRLMRTQLEIGKLFGAPITYVGFGDDDSMMAHWAARRGVPCIGSELGGGGTVTTASLEIAETGIRRALKHVGVLRDDYPVDPPAETRVMKIEGADYYCHATDDGLFEPYVELGAEVETDQPGGAIHFPEQPWREPTIVRFARAGTVICKRLPARTERGDCLFHLATDYQ